MTNTHSPDWTQRYEDLRAHTLGSLAALQSQAWGLALFVQQGMRGWMHAWQDPLQSASDQTRPALLPNPSLNSAPEATLLLANMTLRCLNFAL
jgi:hypothetical protein